MSSVGFRKRKVGPEYYFERGEGCLNDGNYPWAIESFTKAIEFNPGLEMAYYRRAEAYRKLGKNREAIWDYIKFLETDRRQPDMVDDFKGAMKEAVKIARRDLEKDRVKEEIISFGIPGLIDELIEGYDPLKEYADKHFYRLALSWLEGNLKQDTRRIGFVKVLSGEYEEAIKEFDRGFEETPGTPDTHYFKGIAILSLKKRAEGGRRIFSRGESMERLSERARECFEQALMMGYGWRLCPACGCRGLSETSFCAHCGGKLLTGDN
ncbi:hypothetical protein DRO27_02750 [Candidatus Bathyarchaeota archaeon]|nr:MAG: hypothetical protein DRO27_02750 [Candidatus Bathyarchaeota archaeon]